ncbi:MAG: hypothetical protein WAN22_06335 [Solirubrobacteraceae bacterium]
MPVDGVASSPGGQDWWCGFRFQVRRPRQRLPVPGPEAWRDRDDSEILGRDPHGVRRARYRARRTRRCETADHVQSFTDDLCWNLSNGCAGDIRLNNWAANGYGLVRPVLFTARDGATISGHVWATVAGPARRPGIVITDGSVQADENMYWYAAQALAKAG